MNKSLIQGASLGSGAIKTDQPKQINGYDYRDEILSRLTLLKKLQDDTLAAAIEKQQILLSTDIFSGFDVSATLQTLTCDGQSFYDNVLRLLNEGIDATERTLHIIKSM